MFEKKGYLNIGNYYKESTVEIDNKNCLVKTLSFLPLIIVYIIIFAFAEKNYYNSIKTDFNDILFNWKTSPIKLIQLTDKNKCNYVFGKYKNNVVSDWKGNYFNIKKK